MWVNKLCHVCALPLHPTWSMTSTHLAKGNNGPRAEPCVSAPSHPQSRSCASGHPAAARADSPTPGSACLGQILSKDSLHQFLYPAPQYCPTHQEIRTYPWTRADRVTCVDHRMWQKWWYANSRPGNIHFLPLKPINRLQGKFKTSHWRERPHRGPRW